MTSWSVKSTLILILLILVSGRSFAQDTGTPPLFEAGFEDEMRLIQSGNSCDPYDAIRVTFYNSVEQCQDDCLSRGPDACNYVTYHEGSGFCHLFQDCRMDSSAYWDIYRRLSPDMCERTTCPESWDPECSDPGICNPVDGTCGGFIAIRNGETCNDNNPTGRSAGGVCDGGGRCASTCSDELTCSGNGVCNGNPVQSSEFNQRYAPACNCDSGFNGLWCERDICGEHTCESTPDECRNSATCEIRGSQETITRSGIYPYTDNSNQYAACVYDLQAEGTACATGQCSAECPMYTDTAFPELSGDLIIYGIGSTAEACREKCSSNNECNAWEFTSGDFSRCNLYRGTLTEATTAVTEPGTISGPRCEPGECYAPDEFICLTAADGTACATDQVCSNGACIDEGDYFCSTAANGDVCGADEFGDKTCTAGVCLGQDPVMVLIANGQSCGNAGQRWGPGPAGPACLDWCLGEPNCKYAYPATFGCIWWEQQCALDQSAFWTIYRKTSADMCEGTTCRAGQTCNAETGACN